MGNELLSHLLSVTVVVHFPSSFYSIFQRDRLFDAHQMTNISQLKAEDFTLKTPKMATRPKRTRFETSRQRGIPTQKSSFFN